MLCIIPFTLAILQITRYTVYATNLASCQGSCQCSENEACSESWISKYFQEACTPRVPDRIPLNWGTKPPQATSKHDLDGDTNKPQARPAGHQITSGTGELSLIPNSHKQPPTPKTPVQPKKRMYSQTLGLKSPSPRWQWHPEDRLTSTKVRTVEQRPEAETGSGTGCQVKRHCGRPRKFRTEEHRHETLKKQKQAAYCRQKMRIKNLHEDMLTDTKMKNIVARVETYILKGTGTLTREELLEFLSYFGLRSDSMHNHITSADITEILTWLFEWAPKLHGQQPQEENLDIVAELTCQVHAQQGQAENNKGKKSRKTRSDKNCFANRLVIACWKAGHKEFNTWVILIFMHSNDLITIGPKKKKSDIKPLLEESETEFQNYMQKVYPGGGGDNIDKCCSLHST